MNKTYLTKILIFFIFSLIFSLILVLLYLQIILLDYFLYHEISYNNCISEIMFSEDSSSMMNKSSINPIDESDSCSCSSCSCVSSSRSLNNFTRNRFGFISKYTRSSNEIFNKLKYRIKNKTSSAIHKIKLIDNVLSLIFKGRK